MNNYLADKKIVVLSSLVLGILALFLLVQTFNAIKSYRTIGVGVVPTNVITVSGTGEVSAAPNIATIDFTVSAEGKDPAEAQQKAQPTIEKALAYIKSQGIEDKDVKVVTNGYSLEPVYDYNRKSICTEFSCSSSAPVIIGYRASQTVSIKIRDITKSSSIVGGLGSAGVSNIGSLVYKIEDEDALKSQARQTAITKAKAQAEELAKQLGTRLGRIVSFSENGGGYYPPYYAKDMAVANQSSAVPVAPPLPAGQNTITSNVTIVYEIY